MPAEGITLSEKTETTKVLAQRGATIDELNTVTTPPSFFVNSARVHRSNQPIRVLSGVGSKLPLPLYADVRTF